MKTDYISPDGLHSLHDLFRRRAEKDPGRDAYHYFERVSASWQTLSWSAMHERVRQWSHALAAEQLAAGQRVAILLRNSIEWVLFEQAAFANQLVVVPLYPDDRAENIAYILNDADVRLILVEGLHHIEMLASVSEKLAGLQKILYVETDALQDSDAKAVPVDDWLNGSTPATLPSARDSHELATIVYTSGTTGKPKGVMLSHHNILQNVWAGIHSIYISPDDHFLSFLPLSHMLERTVGYYLPMMSGARVSFARSIPELAEDIVDRNPSILFTVPRIFERVYNRIQASIAAKPGWLQALFRYSIDAGWRHFQYRQRKASWHPQLLLQPIFSLLFHKKIRDRFGRHYRFAICGGAPLDFDVARLFMAIGIPIAQGYGLTEYSPVISVNRLEDNDPGSVGHPLPGVLIRTGENDELLVKGESLMMGYWHNDEATHEIIDSEGWLHTGDKVRVVDGRIYITGRLKDIIVLSNGEKVPPCEIEQSILQDPLFENIIVIGEQRPYLTALVVPNEELGAELADEPGLLNDKLLEHIHNKMSSFPGYARIHRIALCDERWSVENGLLTPTLKPRRQYITERYRQTIDSLYDRH